MRKKEKEVAAYMTLEISLLFPLILSVILCIIYFLFYSYNSTVAFQNAAICALYGKYFSHENEDKDVQVNQMYQVLELLNEEQYIMQTDLKQKVAVEGKNIVIMQKGNVNIPLLNPEIMSRLDFEECVEVKMENAVSYLRGIRKVKNEEK